jgi:hypothetical protein
MISIMVSMSLKDHNSHKKSAVAATPIPKGDHHPPKIRGLAWRHDPGNAQKSINSGALGSDEFTEV